MACVTGLQIVQNIKETYMSLLTLVLFLGIGVLCAHLASKVVSNTLPGGFTTSVLAGVIGAFLGSSYVNSFGPAFEGVSVLPAMAGSAAIILVVSYLGRWMHKSA
jgi:uncharacterized membrane protein YeaQ/YmgE (transglycosylase-associated protein family)